MYGAWRVTLATYCSRHPSCRCHGLRYRQDYHHQANTWNLFGLRAFLLESSPPAEQPLRTTNSDGGPRKTSTSPIDVLGGEDLECVIVRRTSPVGAVLQYVFIRMYKGLEDFWITYQMSKWRPRTQITILENLTSWTILARKFEGPCAQSSSSGGWKSIGKDALLAGIWQPLTTICIWPTITRDCEMTSKAFLQIMLNSYTILSELPRPSNAPNILSHDIFNKVREDESKESVPLTSLLLLIPVLG